MVNKPGWAPLKLNQTGENSCYKCVSIVGCSDYGPTFGGRHEPGWKHLKLNQTGENTFYNCVSIVGCSGYVPTFGGVHDLYIFSDASSSSDSHSNLGYTYSPPSGYSYESNFTRTFLAGSYMFKPDEIETFYFFKSEGEILMIIF